MGAFLLYFQTKNSLPFLKKFSEQNIELTNLNTFNYISNSRNRNQNFVLKKNAIKVFFKLTEIQMVLFFFFLIKKINFFNNFFLKKNYFFFYSFKENKNCLNKYFLNFEKMKNKITKQLFYSKALFFNN